MGKPESKLKEVAEGLLAIVFDSHATEDEVEQAAVTLVDIIAPDVLRDAMKHRLPSWELAIDRMDLGRSTPSDTASREDIDGG